METTFQQIYKGVESALGVSICRSEIIISFKTDLQRIYSVTCKQALSDNFLPPYPLHITDPALHGDVIYIKKYNRDGAGSKWLPVHKV